MQKKLFNTSETITKGNDGGFNNEHYSHWIMLIIIDLRKLLLDDFFNV